MGATFTTAGTWTGQIRTAFETATSVGGTYPAAGYIYRRKILILERQRFGKGCTAFTTNVGNTAAGSTISFTNGADTLTGDAGDTYMLKTSNLIESPKGSGMWMEIEVAIAYQDWAEWALP